MYITHLARTLHGTQAELDIHLPEPLRAAYDGLEVVFYPNHFDSFSKTQQDHTICKTKDLLFESKDVSFCRQIRKSYTKITNTCNVLQRL